MSEKNKPFKILSIDGGGIKGLYSATILQHLENEYGRISDYFDMICGTSTGGLIALALAQQISTTTICETYEKKGRIIFPKQPKWKGILKQTMWYGKFSDEPLRRVLKELFGEKKIGESANILCIPSYDVTDARPWVFKFDHADLPGRDNKAFCVDVALATSAAPTYFPICEIDYYDNKQFVDGGVWANNPTLVGVIEAMKYFVGKDREFKSIEVLSISSLNNVAGKPVGMKRKRSFLGWRNDLFETSLIGQSHFTDYMMKSFCELNDINVKYLRIPSESISAEQQHLVQLDCATEQAIKFIKGKGNDRGYLVQKDIAVGEFFKEMKHFKTHNNG
jgi:patatin-like phospholipase/acyl hydrolase